MSTRTYVLAAASLALVATGVVAEQHSAAASGRSFTVNEKLVTLSESNVGKGPIGKRFDYISHMFDRSGRKIGVAVGEGVLLPGKSGSDQLYNFVATYRLHGDQIVTAGIFDFARTKNVFAIVGGTGRYQGASGQLEFITKSDTEFIDTFRF